MGFIFTKSHLTLNLCSKINSYQQWSHCFLKQHAQSLWCKQFYWKREKTSQTKNCVPPRRFVFTRKISMIRDYTRTAAHYLDVDNANIGIVFGKHCYLSTIPIAQLTRHVKISVHIFCAFLVGRLFECNTLQRGRVGGREESYFQVTLMR